MLMTKWGEALDKTCPLSEYPRPQFVRDSYYCLNGMWQCAFTGSAAIPEKMEQDICVPFSPETPLSGVNRTLQAGEYLHYRRVFTLPSDFNKGRVFIHFGAVDQMCNVFLNGQKVGSHRGGYTPFRLELTEALSDGENCLEVTVKDYTDNNQYSRGKQKTKRGGIWYSPQSGIWQSVWLESTPQQYLERVKITPDYDREEVRFEFFGTDEVETLIYDGDTLLADTMDKVIKLPDFKSWSPEQPFLYHVVFKACGETIQSYFGMRKFSVGTDAAGVPRLFLNNKPYFHNGLLDQGYYPDGFLTPPSNAAMENDVQYVKSCGFNMLRKHIKMEPLLWYHYCDVNGILVWQDMINGGGKYGLEVSAIPFVGIVMDDTKYKGFRRTDAGCRELYYQELREMVDTLYNCPCIALWVPFNEGWGQFDSSKAYALLKEWDPTRIVDSASGWHACGKSDVISKHIYFTPIQVHQGDCPWLLTEFGGYALKTQGHTWSEKKFGYRIYPNTDKLTKAYTRLFEKTIIPQIKDGLSATVYTQVTDVEDEINGLMTYDRKVNKISPEVLKKINEKVKL